MQAMAACLACESGRAIELGDCARLSLGADEVPEPEERRVHYTRLAVICTGSRAVFSDAGQHHMFSS
jgi:hypothetical protein